MDSPSFEGFHRGLSNIQIATICQRQFANRSTGSRFAVNASRYTGNLINHLSLDGNRHTRSQFVRHSENILQVTVKGC